MLKALDYRSCCHLAIACKASFAYKIQIVLIMTFNKSICWSKGSVKSFSSNQINDSSSIIHIFQQKSMQFFSLRFIKLINKVCLIWSNALVAISWFTSSPICFNGIFWTPTFTPELNTEDLPVTFFCRTGTTTDNFEVIERFPKDQKRNIFWMVTECIKVEPLNIIFA